MTVCHGAVVYPLRHYTIMMRARTWLFAVTWLTCAAQMILGLFAYLLDMETFSEHVGMQGGNSTFTGCRWETALANFHTIVMELGFVTVSLVTASLLVYTGVLGYRFKRRLAREKQLRENHTNNDDRDNNQTFLDNYRAFKWIMIVLSLTASLDIVAPILRISSRWYPRPKLNGFLHQVRLFGIIFEGWAYGLLNAKLRAAYRKMFCGKPTSNRVAVFEEVQRPPQDTRQEAWAVGAAAVLHSIESGEADGRNNLELSPSQLLSGT